MNAVKSVPLARALGLLALSPVAALAHQGTEPVRWQLNMIEGVTQTSQNAYHAHMIMLWICVVIGVGVFGAMGYAMFRFRKSRGAVPDTGFTHSTVLEAIWTIVPILILVGSAIPATRMVIQQYNADHDATPAEMTVKITGYQWMWQYDYVDQDVSFISRLDRTSDVLRQDKSASQAAIAGKEHYLRDVDNPLVIPADTRIRFVITADDVIHAWWVPALGWKQDAVPGIVNEAWTDISTPGIYRGQCAELCGKDHGFMPIVVKVVPKAEYQSWLAAQQNGGDAAQTAAAPAAPVEAATPAAPAVDAPAPALAASAG